MVTRAFLLAPFLLLPAALAQSPRDIIDAAVADFEARRIAQSVAGFDKLAQLVPEFAPQLWQRGIALYYAARYKDCREQFESHRTVNPADVENAAWHFLCVARLESPVKAKAALLPVGSDSRVPMHEIYEMFAGKISPDQVMKAAGTTPGGQFYAYLYTGLYYEATGNRARAAQQIATAADDRFSAAGGYMHMVARVHRDLGKENKPPAR